MASNTKKKLPAKTSKAPRKSNAKGTAPPSPAAKKSAKPPAAPSKKTSVKAAPPPPPPAGKKAPVKAPAPPSPAKSAPKGPASPAKGSSNAAPPPAPASKPAPKSKAEDKSAAPAAAAPKGAPPAKNNGAETADAKKAGPKGITVVQPKVVRKPKVKSKIQMPVDPLFKPGAKWKPLIPSGPNATPTGLIGSNRAAPGLDASKLKTKLSKKELDGFRKILLRKRSELVGDIANMEDEALRQSSGSLSQLPQHMAEQGTDTFEQSLSLDLAAVDRSLIREIDDALKRIEDGVYGMCERTGVQIDSDRLAELPWARYSIEAARELERRPYQE